MKSQIQIAKDIITNLFESKSDYILEYSLIGSLSVSLISLMEGKFLGVPSVFILLICLLMFLDWVVSLFAESDITFKDRITYTFLKYILFFFWIWLIDILQSNYEDISYISFCLEFVNIFILILITLREFISIGNNMNKYYGNKPYLLTLVEYLFKSVEDKFKDKIDKNDKEK